MAISKKHRETLLVLSKASPKLVRKIILSADISFIRALSECALNVLKGKVPMTSVRKRKMSKFAPDLRTLASKRGSVTKKKKVLQTGGFLPLLASIIAPLVLKTLF